MSMTLPSNWQVESLGKCCTIVSGATPRRDVPEYWDNHIPWVTPKDISNLNGHILEDTPEYISEVGYKNCSTKLLPTGSVLFSSRAPIGLVALTGREMCTNQGFKSLIPGKKVHSEYLYHCMRRMAPKIAELGNGATFKEVSKEVISRVEIPLPPLAEQKRIAAILDKADAIRRKRQAAIKLADDFLRATFLDIFGDPVTNPKGWDVKPLEKLVTFRTGKLDSNAATTGGRYPFFTCSRENFQIDTYAFDCEALLLAGNNAAGEYSVKYYKGKFNAYQRTYVLTINGDKLSYRYLQQALEMKLQDLKRMSKGTNTKYLTLGILYGLPFQIPSKGAVLSYGKLVDKFENNKMTLRNFEQLADANFNSLAQRAFRGEL